MHRTAGTRPAMSDGVNQVDDSNSSGYRGAGMWGERDSLELAFRAKFTTTALPPAREEGHIRKVFFIKSFGTLSKLCPFVCPTSPENPKICQHLPTKKRAGNPLLSGISAPYFIDKTRVRRLSRQLCAGGLHFLFFGRADLLYQDVEFDPRSSARIVKISYDHFVTHFFDHELYEAPSPHLAIHPAGLYSLRLKVSHRKLTDKFGVVYAEDLFGRNTHLDTVTGLFVNQGGFHRRILNVDTHYETARLRPGNEARRRQAQRSAFRIRSLPWNIP